MKTERWRRVEELFSLVEDLDPQGRAQLLERACGDDHELRREVESLLRSSTQSARFIERILGASGD